MAAFLPWAALASPFIYKALFDSDVRTNPAYKPFKQAIKRGKKAKKAKKYLKFKAHRADDYNSRSRTARDRTVKLPVYRSKWPSSGVHKQLL